ncbi:hypothetical protein BHE74_00025471 [Ensete ventricosum]|nr:hypothetical protein GW17_00001916 [Ensete ventricosum]RWW67127.1 hypothetical protein BHE74_00025471 [Ensete ventricosum]RZS20565.1 hypothetical protein BHM03_00053096 [Ensete ventricosum]
MDWLPSPERSRWSMAIDRNFTLHRTPGNNYLFGQHLGPATLVRCMGGPAPRMWMKEVAPRKANNGDWVGVPAAGLPVFTSACCEKSDLLVLSSWKKVKTAER